MLQEMHARAIFHRERGTTQGNSWKQLSEAERIAYRMKANAEMLDRGAPHLHP